MKGIILAGGMGTRLHPITLEIPKPLLPIHRKPIIQYLVELFRSHGVDEIFVLANKRDIDLFEKWNGEYRNREVALVREEERLGTWGGIQKYISDKLTDTFIVSNGDELKENNIGELVTFHRSKKALVTIASVEVPNAKDYGVLVSDTSGKVKEFLYKPAHPPSNFIMSGLYAAEPDLFDFHFESDGISFEEDVLPRILRDGSLFEYKTKSRWYDCGTFERYEKAIQEW